MIMADILMWFLLIVGIILVFNAYWLASASLSPGGVNRFQAEYRRPLRATLAGVACVVPLVLAAVLCFRLKHPVANLVGLLFIGAPIMFGMAGSAGFAQRLGAGLAVEADVRQPWRRVLRGGMVLAFMMLLPFIGWFVVLPWTLISGVGAVVLARRGGGFEDPASPAAGSGAGSVDAHASGLNPA